MITKLNSKRIGSIIFVGLVIFILSFNLLHSVRYEVEESEAKDLAQKLVQKQKEIVQNIYQRQRLEKQLKLNIAKLAHNGKTLFKLIAPDTAKDVDVIRKQSSPIERSVAAVDYAQGLVVASERAEQVEDSGLEQVTKRLKMHGDTTINVERNVIKKLIMTILRHHFTRMNSAMEDLKELRRNRVAESDREALIVLLETKPRAMTQKRCNIYDELDHNLFGLLLPQLLKTVGQSSKETIRTFAQHMHPVREQFEAMCAEIVYRIQNLEVRGPVDDVIPTESMIDFVGSGYKFNFMMRFNAQFLQDLASGKSDLLMGFTETEAKRIASGSSQISVPEDIKIDIELNL